MAEVRELRFTSLGEGDDVDDEDGVAFPSFGNAAFRRGEYEEAVKFYSEELRRPSANSAIILSNRSAAYCKQSEQLRKFPARLSERKPRDGLDPISLLQLALRDAEKVLKTWKNWPKAHLRKGIALVQLEQYERARDAFLEGLQLDPSDKALQRALEDLNAEFLSQIKPLDISQKQKRAKLERLDELDCTVCLKLLYSPVTTPCGHSFCRACLFQAMKHGNKCPMCRTVLFGDPKNSVVSVTLNNLIQNNFPDEYEERKAEMEGVTLEGKETLPLFVMDFVLPSERMTLNIFEPRYRLMVRRVMEGNHRMGMVGLDERSILDIGCEVEICECRPQLDGRLHIEVEGRRRFGITKTWEQDGYRVAHVNWIKDVPFEEDSEEKNQLNELLKNASSLAKAWLQRGHDLAGLDRRAIMDMVKRIETTRDSNQAETFSFWIAKFLRTRPHERLQLLRTTDTRQRLNLEIQLLCDVQRWSMQ